MCIRLGSGSCVCHHITEPQSLTPRTSTTLLNALDMMISSSSTKLARHIIGLTGRNTKKDILGANGVVNHHSKNPKWFSTPAAAAVKHQPQQQQQAEEVTFLRLNNLQDNPGAVKKVCDTL